jgi:ribosomal protein L37AE/L43A
MTIVPTHTGPQCPRCGVTLLPDMIRTGVITCPSCNRRFEATVFSPPQRKQAVTPEVMTVGPDGANACANHARNAATASCQRCGLFICALCDMNVGTGSYCPTCFERVRMEGSLQPVARRYRDYATIARSTAIGGILLSFMFLGVPCGVMAAYFGVKAIKQRRNEGRTTVGVIFTVVVGILEILAGLAWIGFLLYAIGKAK